MASDKDTGHSPHDTARSTEASRRAVLQQFVRLELFDEDHAAGMLTWLHCGFHVHTAVVEGPFGCLRRTARSPPASRATARAVRSRSNGSLATAARRR
jgi:hypothetical protein